MPYYDLKAPLTNKPIKPWKIVLDLVTEGHHKDCPDKMIIVIETHNHDNYTDLLSENDFIKTSVFDLVQAKIFRGNIGEGFTLSRRMIVSAVCDYDEPRLRGMLQSMADAECDGAIKYLNAP